MTQKLSKNITQQNKQELLLHPETLNLFPGGAAILYVYKDGRVESVYHNNSYYEILNTTRDKRENAEKLNGLSFVHPDDVEETKETLAKALQQPKAELDVRLKKDDGDYCWINMKCSVLEIYPDKTALLLNGTDISDLKHMEEKFLELEKTMDARVKLEEERIRQDDTHVYAYTVTNLTKGVILNHSQYAPNAPAVSQTSDFEENIKEAMKSIVYDDDRAAFARIHDREYLLNEFGLGRTAINIEFRRKQRDGMISWVRNVLHLVEEPNTANIFLYEYCYDVNATKSVEVVTYAAIMQTYECLASIDLIHGQTTYLNQYNVRQGKSAVMGIYQDVLENYIGKVVVPEDRADCWKNFSVENLRKRLEEQETYEFIYHVKSEEGELRVMRGKFLYYDKKKHRCLMMTTDVTDILKEEEEDRRKAELASVMGSFPGGVITMEGTEDENKRHKIIYCAKGVAELVGYDLDEFIDRYNNRLTTLVFEADLAAIFSRMNKLIETGKPLDLTYRVINKQGNVIWIREYASLMEEEDGHKIIVAVFQNISEETKLYQKIIDDSNNAVQVIDRVTREVYYANAKAIELAGISDYAGMRCYEFFGKTDAPCAFCNYQDGKLEAKEVEIKRLNKTFLMRGAFTEWHERSVFVENLQDITTHKQLQKDYDSYTKSVVNMVTDAAVVGRINVSEDTIYNVSSEFVSFSNIDFPCTIQQFIDNAVTFTQDQEERAAYKKLFTRDNLLKHFLEGNNIVKYQHHCELSSGNIVIMESGAQLMLNPNNGDIEGVIYSRDITQEAISEQILQQLMSSGYEGVELIDTVNGTCSIRIFNLGYGTGDILHINDYAENCRTSARKYIYPEDSENFLKYSSIENLVAQLATKNSYSYTIRNRVNETTTYKRCTYSYLGQGRSTIMGTIEDVTSIVEETEHQKAELQNALQVANDAAKAKNEFFSLMSHDMRTPLNGIIGLSYLLQEQNDIEVVKKYIAQLRGSGEYLLRLINDVLDISKIENDKLELYPKPCREEEIYGSVIEMITPMAVGKDINFHFEKGNEQWQNVLVDEQRIKQIIVNLLSNAVKYTNSQGNVEFSVEALALNDAAVQRKYVVKDNGIGMTQEFLPHIFESFKQEGRANKATGSGLGMPIVKQLVDKMGGTINIESQVDKGTTVTVILELPLAKKEDSALLAQTTEVNLVDLKDKKILLCEDHPLNSYIAKQLLEKRGMKVTTAANGQLGVEAFAKSKENYFDAILMDIRMPVMSGLEAASAIRKLQRNDAATIPIIALSANAFEEDKQESKKAGMNAHLSKPIQVKELYNVLEHSIKNQRITRKSVVLVVDDLEINRAVIKVAIEGECDVLEAHNGGEALQALEKHPEIDAVVTDIHMPGMDGVELVRRIRANKDYNHIALLVNTQYGEAKLRDELTRLGVDEFIYKAVSPQIIIMSLRNIMRKHSQ